MTIFQSGVRQTGHMVSKMNKQDSAKVMAVKYVLDYNTFKKSDRLKTDLVDININYGNDEEYNALFDRYCRELKECNGEKPLWARKIMAERYSLIV